MPRRLFASMLAVLWMLLAMPAGTLLAVPKACGCPFCSMQGQTLTTEINQASMVLYGTLENATNENAMGEGTTDLKIEAVVKKHDILAGQKTIKLARYLPPREKGEKYLIFCDVFKGKIDPYRGFPVKPKSNIVKYLEGALKCKDKKIGERLRFFFDYLEDDELEVKNDAYKEFAIADYKDYREMAKDLPADKIAGWLENKDTPSYRHGLYASLLGHCGKPKHAEVLLKLLVDTERRVTTGVDGLLAGYVLLKPKEGWEFLVGVLSNQKKEFPTRYAALRAARFFYDMRSDVVSKKDVIAAVAHLLDQGDAADLAIEDFRRWKVWDQCDKILSLRKLESHDLPIIRRCILRYALCCPSPAAVAYVKAERSRDAEAVNDAEELLKLDTATTPNNGTKSK
jgi:hypothetical protein